jgi:hypothetical protein
VVTRRAVRSPPPPGAARPSLYSLAVADRGTRVPYRTLTHAPYPFTTAVPWATLITQRLPAFADSGMEGIAAV